MQANKRDFLHLTGRRPPKDRDRSPAYVTAIEAVIPDKDPYVCTLFLEAFEKLIALTVCVTQHVRLMSAREKAVRHAAGKRGGFALPTILPVHFRLCTQAFRAFTLESIAFVCNGRVHPVSCGALSVLQTIFEALQDGVVTPVTLDGRVKLRLDSPTNGVACEIFAMDTDAVGMTDSAGEDDDTEDFQMDDQDADDASDEADEAVMLELEAQDENDLDEYDSETNPYEDFSDGDDYNDEE
jgi:hypothetical protein